MSFYNNLYHLAGPAGDTILHVHNDPTSISVPMPTSDGVPYVTVPKSSSRATSGRACRPPLGDKTRDLNLVRGIRLYINYSLSSQHR